MADEWRAPAFAGLAGLFYVLACGWFAGRLHPFRIVGATGIAVAAIVLSYSESWHYWRTAHAWSANLVAVALVLSATVLAAWLWRRKADINVVACLLPLVATAVAMAGMDKNFAAGVMNFYAFALGAFTLWRGVGSDRLGAVNSGMLILSALLIARFFDSDLGFVVRGVGFILVGAGFLAVNIFILRRRKEGRP
jgi:hypothetical protein